MNKKVISSVAALLIFAVSCPPVFPVHKASAAPPLKPVTVFLGGEEQHFDQKPVIVNGSTLVPFRALFEALGAKVGWNDSTRTVTGIMNGKQVKLQIGSKLAMVGGGNVSLEQEAQLINSSTMVPLRFVSESLGMYVGWDNDSRSVYISKDEILGGRTKEEIRQKSLELAPTNTGGTFITQPSVSPASPGVINPDFVNDGVKMANYMRYLAGLPADLEQNSSLSEQAQYGAVLLSAFGTLSHTPSKPEGMNDAFYKIGYKSTSSSNIAFGGAKAEDTVKMYMKDEDQSNIDRVGHRRWILNPQLKNVGFGFSAGTYGNYPSYYSAMQVFDKSRPETVDFDYIAWPNKGFFPLQHFASEDPWSISLNPKKYKKPIAANIQVLVTRDSDKRVWSLSSQDSTVSKSGNYFNVNNDGYGVPYCIIFRPQNLPALKEDDSYTVTLTGIYDIETNPVKINYSVRFFNL